MARYRKKHVEIEAQQVPSPVDAEGRAAMDAWLAANQGARPARWADDGGLIVPTIEGERRAEPGDWIIRGVPGELYPCKPENFAVTYEAAPE